MLLERLELYLSAGLGVHEALEVCAQGLGKKQKDSLLRIQASVQAGFTLSAGLQREIGLSRTIAGLISQGEASGSLVKSLVSGRSLLERQEELIKKSVSAMVYPGVIGCFACFLIIGLTRGVLPQIIPMLKSLNVKLPILTRAVIAFSEGLTAYGLYILFAVIVGLIIWPLLYKRQKSFRFYVQIVLLRLPLLGSLFRRYSLIVFLRSLGSLIESGVRINIAYSGTVQTLTLLPLQKYLSQAESLVIKGIPLGKILSVKPIPSFLGPLISAGESSGQLGASIIRAADILDREMEHSLKKITSLIEPIMMIGLGLVVGGIALSIMMPIYDISRVLQK